MEERDKRPESVLIVVATMQADVLMLRRREPTDFWQSVTGSLEWGESAATAARRELEEETGLLQADIEASSIVNHYPIAPAWRHRYAPHVTMNTEYVFQVRLAGRAAIRLSPKEHSEARWLRSHAAARLASSRTNRAAIRELIDRAR